MSVVYKAGKSCFRVCFTSIVILCLTDLPPEVAMNLQPHFAYAAAAGAGFPRGMHPQMAAAGAVPTLMPGIAAPPGHAMTMGMPIGMFPHAGAVAGAPMALMPGIPRTMDPQAARAQMSALHIRPG